MGKLKPYAENAYKLSTMCRQLVSRPDCGRNSPPANSVFDCRRKEFWKQTQTTYDEQDGQTYPVDTNVVSMGKYMIIVDRPEKPEKVETLWVIDQQGTLVKMVQEHSTSEDRATDITDRRLEDVVLADLPLETGVMLIKAIEAIAIENMTRLYAQLGINIAIVRFSNSDN